MKNSGDLLYVFTIYFTFNSDTTEIYICPLNATLLDLRHVLNKR